jgi:hypothetical protein
MKKRVRETRILVVLFAALALCAATSAQESHQKPTIVQTKYDVQPSAPEKNNPHPEDPTKAVLAAFDKYEVVGMGAGHGYKDLDDLILHLLRDPAFPDKVNDVVVECGNSLYQSTLDRYIAGGEVSLSEVRQVWRNTTQPMCSTSGFYEILFPLIRRINQRLPPQKRLRMLAGDPPVDWSQVTKQSEVMLDRDASIASVMQTEVLSKHRKALMLFGEFHLFHSKPNAPEGLESAVQRYEKHYPGVTMVIGGAMVFIFPDSPPATGEELEARMASWPAPSLVQNIKSTWLWEADKTYFSKMVDAYLYLGPSSLMLVEPRPAEMFSNKSYMEELRRRAAIIGDRFVTDQMNSDNLSDLNYSPFLF